MNLIKIKELFNLQDYDLVKIKSENNVVYKCVLDGQNDYIIKCYPDFNDDVLLTAQLEYMKFLYDNDCDAVDVIESINGNYFEKIICNHYSYNVCCFSYAEGRLMKNYGYDYRCGLLSEYLFNIGKTIGKIHTTSKRYHPVNKRNDFFTIYNKEYIDFVMEDNYSEVKQLIIDRLNEFSKLEKTIRNYGLIHFNFSDECYHVDNKTGDITVFNFDDCIYNFYLYDLASCYLDCRKLATKLDEGTKQFFLASALTSILEGYRSKCLFTIEEEKDLPVFVQMVALVNIVDKFVLAKRNRETVKYSQIEFETDILKNSVEIIGLGVDIYK